MLHGLQTQSWWDKNALASPDFAGWIGDHTTPAKSEARAYVHRVGYRSVLDAGCGLCTEFLGYREYPDVLWSGVDSCAALVEQASARGVPRVKHGEITALPYSHESFDVVFTRHVLEHLPDYREALRECVRVAKHEVLILWFIPPGDTPDKINLADGLYHNAYNRSDLERFLYGLDRVGGLRWEMLGMDATLHILLS